MIANAAFLATLTVFFLAAWLASELAFLAQYRTAILREHGLLLGSIALILFLNLTAFYYTAARWFFLRETGRKLEHVDRQMQTSDGALEELRNLLNS
jgi:hypothetical protein